MAPLGTGRFIITNSKFKNVAYLADANSLSDLRADSQRDHPGEMWNVVLLRNGNYTIQNHDYSSYATCEDIVKPDVGNHIVAGDREQQWKIIEVQGNSYVICPTRNGQVCWHLVDEESGTPITLDHYSHTDKIQWKFSQVKDAKGSGALDEEEDDDSDDHDHDNETEYQPFRESIGSIVDRDGPLLDSLGPGYYDFSLAGTSLHLRPEGLSSQPPMPNTRVILSNPLPYEKMWYLIRTGNNWWITFCPKVSSMSMAPSTLFLSIPEHGEACLTDEWIKLSLTPVGGPNEVRITDVKSGRSWDSFVITFRGY